MSLFSRWRKQKQITVSAGEPAAKDPAKSKSATLAHFKDFTTTRVGVEAYVEPATNVTQTTLLLIATDGEWTRRKVPDTKAAYQVAKDLQIPIYDVQLTGYPQRMRDWSERRHRELKKRK